MIDVPTLYADGGNGRGNYCTLNPLFGSTNTIQNGNLELTGTAASSTQRLGTVTVSSGKWYYEVELSTLPASMDPLIGFTEINDTSAVSQYPGQAANSYAIYILSSNTFLQKVNNNSFVNTNTTVAAQGDVISVALDLDNGKIWFAKNNTWVDSGVPGSGTNPQYTGLSGTFAPALRGTGGATTTTLAANFGQRAFAYTPPTGFLALNTQNLPEPTIKRPSSYFDTKLYTGTAATLNITGLEFSPDLVWTKNRSSINNHRLYDTLRGTTKELYSNATDSETTDANSLTAFNSDGFTLGSSNGPNNSGSSYVAWCWDKNPSAGLDIVTYTGNGITGRTVSHNLGVRPSMVMVKLRAGGTYGWPVWSSGLYSVSDSLLLNSTNFIRTAADRFTNFSSTTMTLGNNSEVNGNTITYVAYLWSEVAGFSKFGSYAGNSSTDGPFVYCGFRPKWVMVKADQAASTPWFIKDSTRGTYNVMGPEVFANASDAETTVNRLDFLSNGFKLRAANTADNQSGAFSYIFAAFAESPFKYSLAR